MVVCHLKVISGHLGWVRCIAVEPGNEWFVTGAGDRVIKVCTDSYMKNCFNSLPPYSTMLGFSLVSCLMLFS